MNIDWTHFTPWASLAGGVLLGVASAILILFNGRILGISGILGGLLSPRSGDTGFVAGGMWLSSESVRFLRRSRCRGPRPAA